VYRDVQSVRGVLFFMYDEHINYANPHILYEIADRFGNAECKHVCEKYQETFKSFVKKCPDHPAPTTDEDIEPCSSRRLETSASANVDETSQDV